MDKLVRRGVGKVLDYRKMLAQVYVRLDEPGKAKDVLKKAYAQSPKDIDILVGLSFVESLRKQYKDAVRYATEAVKAAPKDIRAHLAVFRAGVSLSGDFEPDDKQKRAFSESLTFLFLHGS